MGLKDFILKRKYFLLSTILSFISGIIVGYALMDFTHLAGFMAWIGGTVSFTWLVNMLVGAYNERKRQQNEERKKEERIRKKLNDNVFKKWEKVSGTPYMLHVKIKIEEKIDQYLFGKAKKLLKDESDQTREILGLWNQIDENLEDSLSFEYNKMGKKVEEKIIKSICKAYSSLQPEEARFVKIHDNCFVTDNIIRFVESSLKPKFLKNEPIDWEKILEKQFYHDVKPPIWSLNCHGICIQSENESDVYQKNFQNVMKDLMQSIRHQLKQLDELQEKIDTNLKDFKEKMHRMTVDIDLLMD